MYTVIIPSKGDHVLLNDGIVGEVLDVCGEQFLFATDISHVQWHDFVDIKMFLPKDEQ